MALREVYAETALEGSDHIRLLEVNASDEKGMLRYTLHRCSLSAHAPYSALSYTWGCRDETRKVVINDITFGIGLNLWRFFAENTVCREGDLLWVDAICIDQDNTRERNNQVKRMRRIYSEADRVIVWLGPLDQSSETATAVEFLNAKKPKKDWLDLPGRNAVFLLLQRAYWTRIWIVQEFLLGKLLLLVCGSKVLYWDALRYAYELLSNEVRSESDDILAPLRMLRDTHMMKIVPIRLEWEERPLPQREFPLRFLIESLSHLESTEPRDKIYGLLGLVGNGIGEEDIQFPVDYSLPITQLYDQVLNHIYPRSESLTTENMKFIQLLRRSLGISRSPVSATTWQHFQLEGPSKSLIPQLFIQYEQLQLQKEEEEKSRAAISMFWKPLEKASTSELRQSSEALTEWIARGNSISK